MPGMSEFQRGDALPESADEAFLAQLDALAGGLRAVTQELVHVSSDALAAGAARAAAVMAAAEATRAAIVLEAHSRGVIDTSDHPRVDKWVEQACREAGVPVTRGQARQLHDIAHSCNGFDLAALREAVTAGQVPLEIAALIARTFRRLNASIDCDNWDAMLQALIDWAAAGGVSGNELAALEDLLIGQYGTADALNNKNAAAHSRRELTRFSRDRDGMLRASLRFDPSSEAVFTAAINALSAPQPKPENNADSALDDRTPGQRRADALLSLARLATSADPRVLGSGPAALAVITLRFDDLAAWTASQPNAQRTPAAGESGADPGSDAAQAEPEHAGPHSEESPGERPSAAPSRGLSRHGWARQHQTGGGCAITDYGQVLSPSEALMLACDAHIVPAILGSSDEPLNVGRTKRLITPAQRTALNLRDKGCSYPTCDAPPAWCDGHHVIHWSNHGPTDLNNLALLCRRHHTVVHRHGHTASVTAAGVHWTRRDGSPISNRTRRTTIPGQSPPKVE